MVKTVEQKETALLVPQAEPNGQGVCGKLLMLCSRRHTQSTNTTDTKDKDQVRGAPTDLEWGETCPP